MAKDDKKPETPEYKTLAFDAQKTAIKNIKESGPKAIFKIIEEHAEAEEIDRRVEIIKKVIGRYNALKKEVDNIKPDVEGAFNALGIQAPGAYSAAVWKNKASKINEINSIVDAMESYEKENDFAKLDKFGSRKEKDA